MAAAAPILSSKSTSCGFQIVEPKDTGIVRAILDIWQSKLCEIIKAVEFLKICTQEELFQKIIEVECKDLKDLNEKNEYAKKRAGCLIALGLNSSNNDINELIIKIQKINYDLNLMDDSCRVCYSKRKKLTKYDDAKEHEKDNIRLIEVIDKSNEVQALAIASRCIEDQNAIILETLMTAPWNLKFQIDLSFYSKFLDMAKRVKGAGTSAFEHVIGIAQSESKKEIIGYPFVSAKPFYDTFKVIYEWDATYWCSKFIYKVKQNELSKPAVDTPLKEQPPQEAIASLILPIEGKQSDEKVA